MLSVATGGGAPPDVDIYVLALDASTYATVDEVVVNPSTSLDFSFPDLPPGDYVIAAGSDIDDDGYICDEGEYCGMYPVEGEPVTVTLGDGDDRSGLDFVVTPGDAIGGAAAGGSGACGLRRRSAP
jgi:serine protease